MPLDPNQERQIFETAYESFQESASKLGAIYTPQWNVRNDIARTLLTISSAVLVISISLSSHVIAHRWILSVCWSAFLLAILSAIATLWLSLGLYSLPAFVVTARKKLREMVKDFDIENPPAAAGAIVDNLLTNQLNGMEKIDRRAIKTLKASLLMFLVGLICTGVVGWMQLSCP